MPWTDQTNANLQDGILNDGGSFPTITHIALSTTTPTTPGGNFTEPVGNGYARQPVSGVTWTTATVASPSIKDNGVAVTFDQATGGPWGNITHIGYYSALTGGTLAGWAPMTAAKQIDDGDTLNFDPSTIIQQLS